MTRRNDDRQRSVTIGFRVSKEQAERIDLLVALSGKTKQDYIVERLENESWRSYPRPGCRGRSATRCASSAPSWNS